MTKHIVTRKIRDNKIRELGRLCLSRALTTRWMPGALPPVHSSCCRCSSNSASSRHLTFAITNLLITDVGTAGRDTLHPDVAYLQMGDYVHQSDVGYTWKCEDNFVPDGLGQLSRGFQIFPEAAPGCCQGRIFFLLQSLDIWLHLKFTLSLAPQAHLPVKLVVLDSPCLDSKFCVRVFATCFSADLSSMVRAGGLSLATTACLSDKLAPGTF